jgi:hypothetical protein
MQQTSHGQRSRQLVDCASLSLVAAKLDEHQKIFSTIYVKKLCTSLSTHLNYRFVIPTVLSTLNFKSFNNGGMTILRIKEKTKIAHFAITSFTLTGTQNNIMKLNG